VTVELLIFAGGAVLVLNTRTTPAVAVYALLTGVISVLIAPSALATPLSQVLFVVAFALKVVAAPIGIWSFVHRTPVARDLRPAFGLPWRLIVALVAASLAAAVTRLPEFAGLSLIGPAAFAALCGFAMLLIYRSLLAQLIGLLVLGNGLTLGAAILAPGLPEAIEFGAAFDALVVTFIGLALMRAFLTHNPVLDVESLRSLRG
jgi:hydrogenase-4 membrane subunit HyfE